MTNSIPVLLFYNFGHLILLHLLVKLWFNISLNYFEKLYVFTYNFIVYPSNPKNIFGIKLLLKVNNYFIQKSLVTIDLGVHTDAY